jgi:RHS repeat-associated protein
VLATIACFAAPIRAPAQTCVVCESDTENPTISIDPWYGTYANPYVVVTIQWADNVALTASTRQIFFNGVEVTTAFSHSGDGAAMQSTGTVTLTEGENTLLAQIRDQTGNPGSASATYTYSLPLPAPAERVARMDDPAQVDTGVVHPGTGVARDLCLTMTVAAGAAYECGDLRLAHALPATRVLNSARSPVLLYNSQHAHPRPVLPFNVRMVAGNAPSSVRARLWVSEIGGPASMRNERTWSDAQWAEGGVWRFAVSYDALLDTTNVYIYVLEVFATFGGVERQTASYAGHLAVVNRSKSPYGAGWWPAGLEQLVYMPGDGSYMVVGGDGSTRRYTWIANGVWRSAGVGRPDILRAYGAANGRSTFFRNLPDGSIIWYNPDLQHESTTNRLQHTTRFHYNGARLETITMPTGGSAAAAKYVFGYDDQPGRGWLTSICARASDGSCRNTIIQHELGDRRVTRVVDPDNTGVSFGYEGAGRQVRTRTDRRNATTVFAYDGAGRLNESSLVVPEAGHTIRQGFSAAEARGLLSAVPAAKAFTAYDGPRTNVPDSVWVSVNRWGAPTRIRDALGHTTQVTRSNSRFPALVTRVDYPNHRYVTASYDTLSNLEAQTDWGHWRLLANGDTAFSTTRYARTNTDWPNFVTKVTGPEGGVTEIGYYPNGSREWQRPGTDASAAVRFEYNALGLVERVWHPVTASLPQTPELLQYDSLRGNLEYSTTPLGARTVFHTDGLGRTWKTESPIDGGNVVRTETTFVDGTDRPWVVTTSAPMLHGSSPSDLQTVTVENHYDNEGNLRRVDRSSTPNSANVSVITTRWDYDAAGRAFQEWAPDATPTNSADNPRDSTVFDPAGNPLEVHTRRRDATGAPMKITMEYDTLNRLVKRRVPGVEYDPRTHSGTEPLLPAVAIAYGDGMDTLTLPYAYTIRRDSSLFRYHPVHGTLEFAVNGDAQTTRTYYPNGALQSETQRIRNVTGDVFSHEYTIAYEYDLNGRTTELVHDPLFTTHTPRNRTSYRYSAATGLPRYVTDLLGNTFEYRFNHAGQLTRVVRPGGISESFTYTPDGLVKTNSISNASGSAQRYTAAVLRSTTFNYDWRGKVLSSVNTEGTHDQMTARYSGAGHMVYGRMVSDAMLQVGYSGGYQATDEYVYDALGHVVQSTNASSFAYSLGNGLIGGATSNTATATTPQVNQPGTGRLTKSGNEHRTYDASGNTDIVYNHQTAYSERVSYYGADGTVRAADVRRAASPVLDTGEKSRIIEEYRYDALGRRVWVRARNWCSNDPGAYVPVCNISKVRRIVWDGSNELYEIQMPGETGSAYLENDTQATDLAVLPGLVRVDPNPFFGTVVYTPGIGIDQPLSVVRLAYADRLDTGGTDRGQRTLSPFALFPLWNTGGMAEAGVFQDGARSNCVKTYTGSGSYDRCVQVAWPIDYYAYARGSVRRAFWHGTVIEDKRDEANTYFRRNRSYDPGVGRFTQEDPIGLAGGLNLYGYANGDAVSQHDPLGLSCARHGPEKLECTGLNPGDFGTIARFIGGASGERALQTFSAAGWTQWNASNCRGGWNPAECATIANALSLLTLSDDSACSEAGTRAMRRFQSGRTIKAPILGGHADGMAVGAIFPFAFGRYVLMHPRVAGYEVTGIRNVFGHEEQHMHRPWTIIPPWGGSLFHRNAYKFGDRCQS